MKRVFHNNKSMEEILLGSGVLMSLSKKGEGIASYIRKTPRSKELQQTFQQVMPGGATANIKFFEPYPIIMEKGKGSRLYDVDGNEYIDYLLSYGALMLGHGHDRLKKALAEQMKQSGTHLFGAPHHLEVELGKKIQQIYPSMELLRYTNSGTEATLLAVRTAYAYTGKNKIAKFEGHYHGGYDQVLLSVNPPVHKAGSPNQPNPVVESLGVDPYHKKHTIILPFNDLDATADILRKEKDEIAAVIIEPIQGGFIPATQSFMDGLRKVTAELGILLIFDEVKTCFRSGLGGAQQYYGMTPDLTTLGKVIGGGFPIGVTGGKREIMEISAPSAKSDVFDSSQSNRSGAKDVLFHSGTYNGHPMILAAGLETIAILEEKIDHVNEMSNRLKNGITNIFDRHGIAIKAMGIGSIFNIVITDQEEVLNYRDLQHANYALRREIDFHLLTEGIYTKPLNRYSLSVAHGEDEVNQTLEAYEKVLSQVIR